MVNPLDGYGAQPSEAERALRDRLGDNDFLVDMFAIGEEMQAFIETPVGAFMYAELKGTFNNAMAALLGEPDPTTDFARASFFKARTAYAALGLLQDTLRAGTEAGVMIETSDNSR